MLRALYSLLIVIAASGYCVAYDLYIFSAEWCPSCISLKKFLEDDKDLHKSYNIVIVDIDRSPDIKKYFKIRFVPTSIILGDDSIEVTRIIGYDSTYKDTLKKLTK
jgi:thiol-disulfide isomerase/thioredoxin